MCRPRVSRWNLRLTLRYVYTTLSGLVGEGIFNRGRWEGRGWEREGGMEGYVLCRGGEWRGEEGRGRRKVGKGGEGGKEGEEEEERGKNDIFRLSNVPIL